MGKVVLDPLEWEPGSVLVSVFLDVVASVC